MILQVDGIQVSKQKTIIDLVEANENPKFIKCNKKTRLATTILFECNDDIDVEDAKMALKGAIRKDPIGKMLVFRVVEEGKVF